jgi:hypothetical protein
LCHARLDPSCVRPDPRRRKNQRRINIGHPVARAVDVFERFFNKDSR